MPSSRILRFCLAGCACVLITPLVALARPGTGKWVGKLQKNGGTVQFKVVAKGRKLKSFLVHGHYGTLHCYSFSSGLIVSSATIYVPSARIHGNSFSVHYHRHSSAQTEDDYLKGRFHGSGASGTVTQKFSASCGSPHLRWTAHRS